ncbi:MAG: hypothetical protein CM1200mP29_10450 [Verrucomicrobiota bacterium]|nr:MAG: hypothetical protein CM1200mP29_10450 [Verrucomicrobiota bacterium]
MWRFTTGRGSVYGCKPSPCIKVATNTPMYNWMEEDMDINAGTILDGTETVEQVGRRIYEKSSPWQAAKKPKANWPGWATRNSLRGCWPDPVAQWISSILTRRNHFEPRTARRFAIAGHPISPIRNQSPAEARIPVGGRRWALPSQGRGDLLYYSRLRADEGWPSGAGG